MGDAVVWNYVKNATGLLSSTWQSAASYHRIVHRAPISAARRSSGWFCESFHLPSSLLISMRKPTMLWTDRVHVDVSDSMATDSCATLKKRDTSIEDLHHGVSAFDQLKGAIRMDGHVIPGRHRAGRFIPGWRHVNVRTVKNDQDLTRDVAPLRIGPRHVAGEDSIGNRVHVEQDRQVAGDKAALIPRNQRRKAVLPHEFVDRWKIGLGMGRGNVHVRFSSPNAARWAEMARTPAINDFNRDSPTHVPGRFNFRRDRARIEAALYTRRPRG